MRALIRANTILTLDPDDRIFSPGYILIDKGVIQEVGQSDNIHQTKNFDHIIDLDNRLLMPGLINAHTHSPMVLFSGMA